MSTNKEHPLAHILRAIADGVPVEFKHGANGDWYIAKPESHEMFFWDDEVKYRIKPKPKVKKWRWAVASTNGSEAMWVTCEHFATAEEFNSKHRGLFAVQKIDSTMIEVEE